MKLFTEWSGTKGTDQGLIRYAVQGMLLYCGPPFSDEFKVFVLEAAWKGGFERFREAPKGSEYARRLDEFLAECGGGEFGARLGEDVRKHFVHLGGKVLKGA